jgi:hypothetical protein
MKTRIKISSSFAMTFLALWACGVAAKTNQAQSPKVAPLVTPEDEGQMAQNQTPLRSSSQSKSPLPVTNSQAKVNATGSVENVLSGTLVAQTQPSEQTPKPTSAESTEGASEESPPADTDDNEEDEAAADMDFLGELASLGGAMLEGDIDAGGSIRAKRPVDRRTKKAQKDPRNIQARVEHVSLGTFPMVAVKVKITKIGAKAKSLKLKRNQNVIMVPIFKVKGKVVDFGEEDSRRNAGAYYLKRGDKVFLRLTVSNKGIWNGHLIGRK